MSFERDLKTAGAALAVMNEMDTIVAGVDDLIRLDLLVTSLLAADWVIRYERTGGSDDDGPKALWAHKADANIYVPFGDIDKPIVISHEASDTTPAWSASFDQETPVTVLLKTAELVAESA